MSLEERTHPGYPCAAVLPEHHTPCRLESLEIFIWLKESTDTERVDETKCENDS